MIAGAGIGGLTTTLWVHHLGIDCEVYEQSTSIRELGVGINALPHAVAELSALGLLEPLDEVAIRTGELIYATRGHPARGARTNRAGISGSPHP
jgi:2-polyprenyl-6-methoxyphenol hydroxylase-like FAD-dependent oxidoreductase